MRQAIAAEFGVGAGWTPAAGKASGIGMKMYTATIKKEALEPREARAYYMRQKLLFILVMTLVSVIPLCGISFLSLRYYQNSWIDRTGVELGSLAESRQEIIAQFLDNQTNLLAGLVQLYPSGYLSRQENLKQVFDAVNNSGLITDLGVIDSAGRQVAYAGPYDLAGRDYSQADWFAAVSREGSYISDIFSGYRGVPHIVVAVMDPTRQVILRATVNSDLFNSLLERADVGSGGDAFIVNRAGAAQTPSRLGLPDIPGPLADAAGAAGTPVSRTQDYIYATASLKNGDWVLVLKEELAGSLAEFYSARNQVAVLVALAVIAIASVATVISSSLINRIQAADRQRTALYERMREAEKMALVGRLSASVSHEINNPLQIIENQAGWIGELLEDEEAGRPVDRAEYRESVNKIRTHVKRAKDITHGLLGFARGGDGGRAPTDINNLIRETVSFLGGNAQEREIAITRDLRPDLPPVMTDPSQLEQVFLNILGNAMDAIGRGGDIAIDTYMSDDGRVVARFTDSGPGLGEEVRGRLFEPFFTTKAGGGTGLGLSISYNIIQRLGGDIEATNQDQGGSIFQVFLPAAPVAEADTTDQR